MGNVLPLPALSSKGRRRAVQWHEKWHYNTGVQDSLMPVHDLITEVDAFKKKSNQSQDE